MDPGGYPSPGPPPSGPPPPPPGFALGDEEGEREPVSPGQPHALGFEGVDGTPPQVPPESPQLYPSLDPAPDVPPQQNGATTPNNPSAINITVNPINSDDAEEDPAQDMPEEGSPEAERKARLELDKKRNTLKFRDGARQIDFVLVYSDSNGSESQKKMERRETFEKNLLEEGLELEYEDKKMSQDGKTHYVKVHAPWEVLTRMAEIMNIKMPIKEYDNSFSEPGCFDCIPDPFELSEDIVKPEEDYFTADFSRDRESMFIINDKETFFTNAQRSMFTYQLMLRTQYEENAKDKIGIDRLIKQEVYTAAYPLHEGPYTSKNSILTEGPLNDRHLLYEAWAKPSRWYFEQPADLIRRYFGEKVAIYFVWLGFYTMMLIPASVVGLIVFLYGLGTLFSNDPSEEICDKAGPGNFTMCPLCDQRCSYWKLSSSCLYSRLTYLFDNDATVFFACFMAIWSTMFLEFWKRRQAELQYDWDVARFELEERMRPEYEARCQNHQKLNPVTQLMEPFLPIYERITRWCASFLVVIFMMMEPFLPFYQKIPRWFTSHIVVIFMICCVLAAVFGVIMYRIIIVTLLYAADQDIIQQNAKLTTSCTAACINLVVILVLNRFYTRVAICLTDLERPRTDSEYEDSFTFKMYLFQFINYYSSIVYIAFFKGRYTGRPGDYNYLFNYRGEECDPAGCLNELCIQLGIVMVGKQALNNFKELLLPMLQNWFRGRKAKKETDDNLYTRWEQDRNLVEVQFMGLFYEYLEMVVQYGFVTIFVAAFPLAPLFALINNIIEIRLDAYKYVTQQRRSVSQQAQDIGIWFGILKGITYIAVLSNAFIIGWTSDFVPKLVFKYTQGEDKTMKGYIDFSLSYFDVNDFQPQSVPDDPNVEEFGVVQYCRYADYRIPPWITEEKYDYTAFYWHVFTARLAFIIVFEHVVFFLTWLVSYLVPDVPRNVKQLMLREIYIAKEARYTATFANVHRDKAERKREESMDLGDDGPKMDPGPGVEEA